jgi:hypothetical protein
VPAEIPHRLAGRHSSNPPCSAQKDSERFPAQRPVDERDLALSQDDEQSICDIGLQAINLSAPDAI